MGASAAAECSRAACDNDDTESMKVSMLQRKSINEHDHQKQEVVALEARKAELLSELASLEKELSAMDAEEERGNATQAWGGPAPTPAPVNACSASDVAAMQKAG